MEGLMFKPVFICAIAAVLIVTTKPYACECGDNLIFGVDPEKALIDSLNIGFVNDTAFLNRLKNSISNSKICFIGKCISLKRDSATTYVPNPPETLDFSCQKVIKGVVPLKIKIINWAYTGDCMGSANKLVGKQPLIFLNSDTIPNRLRDLGCGVDGCGDMVFGIFITETRVLPLAICTKQWARVRLQFTL